MRTRLPQEEMEGHVRVEVARLTADKDSVKRGTVQHSELADPGYSELETPETEDTGVRWFIEKPSERKRPRQSTYVVSALIPTRGGDAGYRSLPSDEPHPLLEAGIEKGDAPHRYHWDEPEMRDAVNSVLAEVRELGPDSMAVQPIAYTKLEPDVMGVDGEWDELVRGLR